MTVGSGFRFVVCVPKKNDSALLVERAVVFLFLEMALSQQMVDF